MSMELFDADDAWTVMNDPLWPQLKRHIIWEPAEKGHPDRLWIDEKAAGEDLMLEFYCIKSRCAKCGRDIHPVRQGRIYKRAHLSVSCRITARVGCARSREASEEVKRIVQSLKAAA